MLYGESTLNFSCQEVKNRGSTFWHKALIKTEKQLKPQTHTIPGRFSLHTPPPSNIYNICAHSTTHYGYLTRNYLTLKSYVLDSEHGCLHLLIESYFPAKTLLASQKEMERIALYCCGAATSKGSSAGDCKKHQRHNQSHPDPISKWLPERQPVKPHSPAGEHPLSQALSPACV